MSRQSITAGKAVIVVELTDKATAQFGKVVDNLANKMQKLSRAFRDISTNAFGGALLTGMVSSSTLRNFAKFEDTILNLTVKLGYFGNKTNEQIQNIKTLESEILRLGSSTAYTSEQVGQAAVALAQAGFAVDEIQGSLQGVIDLARGTGYALGESADLIANLIRNFELFGANTSLEERMKVTTELSSRLVKATRLGTIEIADLREAFKYAGGKAKELGVDVTELSGFFVQMSEAGLKGSLAGTSLNTMMSNLTKNLDIVLEKFPEFAIQLKDSGKIDLTATVQELIRITKSMNFLDRTTFFQDLFNIRGARALSAVFEIDRVKAFTESIRIAAQESRLAAIEMESGLGGAGRRAYNALDQLRIVIGKVVESEIIALLNALAGLAKSFERVIQQNKALALGLVLSPGILGAIGVAALSLSVVLSRLSLVVRGLGAAFKGISSVGGIMAKSISGTAGMLPKKKPSTRAMQAARVATLQNSITNKLNAPGANPAKIAGSRTMANLISQTLKLQQMGPGGILGFMQGAGRGLMGAGRGIRGGIGGVASFVQSRRQAAAEIKEIQSQIKLEQILARVRERNTSRTLNRLAGARVRGGGSAFHQGAYRSSMSQAFSANAGRVGVQQQLAQHLSGTQYVDQLYDRLYKIRQILKELPQTIQQGNSVQAAGLKTSQTWLKYKEEEVDLARKINLYESKTDRLRARAGTAAQEVRARTATAKVSRQAATRAAGIEQNLQKRITAIQATNQQARATTAARIARARTSMPGMPSIFGAIGKGASSLFSGMKAGGLATLQKLPAMAKGLLSLTTGFLKLSGGMLRFVFSWNFVGMALNGLLLFGDKIPAISKAFSALGAGISGFFSQLGRIASYAAPAMDLFQLAIESFSSGFSDTGFAALQAAFEGIVNIIRNQLIAAWNEFMYHVEYIVVFFQQIYKSIEIIVRSLFTGISQALGMLASPVMQAVGTIGESLSGGGGSLAQTASWVIAGIDAFISEFFKGIITLNDYLMKFLSEFQKVMGQIIGNIPGTGGAGERIQQDARNNQTLYEMQSSMAKAQIEIGRKQREKEIRAIMNQNIDGMAKTRLKTVQNANTASTETMWTMKDTFEQLSKDLKQQMEERQASIAQMQKEAQAPQIPPSRFREEEESIQKQLPQVIKSLVGGVSQTRNYWRTMADEKQVQRDQLNTLKTIERNTRNAGGIQ
jgi:TP901 family phage tail tape measure protein